MKVQLMNLNTAKMETVFIDRHIRVVLENGKHFDISERQDDPGFLAVSCNSVMEILPTAANAIRLKEAQS